MAFFEAETSLKPSEIIQVGSVDAKIVGRLLQKLYRLELSSVKELNSYDDKTYLIQVEGNKFVFKITNTRDTGIPGLIDGQNALMLHLFSKGISCPTPVKNIFGSYWSLETITDGEHAIRLLNFIEGELLTVAVTSPRLLERIGEYLVKVHLALTDFSHPAYNNSNRRGLWSLENVPKIIELTSAIGDANKEALVTSVVKEFQSVLTRLKEFRQSVIHSDFNEQNILVCNSGGQWDVVGILDFGDCHFSCVVFDVAVAIMYAMLDSKGALPLLDIGGYLLKGYRRGGGVITPTEFEVLKVSICARYAQSLTIGLYTYNQNPTPENSYVLITQRNGWDQLRSFWAMDEQLIYDRWREIGGDSG